MSPRKPDGAVGSDASASAARPLASSEPRTFEAAFEQLQNVVEQLEEGGLDLEAALRAFERGAHLARLCEGFIDNAELRVTRLTAESASPLSET